MEKFLKIVLAAIVAGFVGLAIWAFSQSTNTNKDGEADYAQYDVYRVIAADENNGNLGDIVRGKKDSKVVVLEYSDFECPGCAGAQNRMNKVYEKYKDKVAFVSRSMMVHEHAQIAAQAAVGASLQGKYWEMADKLFENQAEWGDENISNDKRIELFKDYFKSVAPNGDAARFEKNMTSNKVLKKVKFDEAIGTKIIEVSETPSFYINGVKFSLDGIKDEDDFFEKFYARIDEELAK